MELHHGFIVSFMVLLRFSIGLRLSKGVVWGLNNLNPVRFNV